MNDTQSNVNTSEAKKNLPGIWLGIDLGTTNTTAAFYSPSNHVTKLIRFTPQFASIQTKNDKYGKILPSAVYYRNGKVACIGKSALAKKQIENSYDGGCHDNDSDPHSGGKKCEGDESNNNGVLLSSVKRIWGMDNIQIKDEIHTDDTFLESCPFQTIWMDDELRIVTIGKSNTDQDHVIGKEDTIAPIDVAEILLRTIREEAKKYFNRERRKRKHFPLGCNHYNTDNKSSNDIVEAQYEIRHCVITIPAHFSRNQKNKVVQAARKAGFDGYINTLVESTAAAMAYGLFVSPTKILKNVDGNNGVATVFEESDRKILVCDIGGGTTDITIAEMKPVDVNGDGESKSMCEPTFSVLATAGERRLGGDDMDKALADFIVDKKIKSQKYVRILDDDRDKWNQFLLSCRQAKETLCGDGKDIMPQQETTIKFDLGQGNKLLDVVINQNEFNNIIKPLIERVSQLVEKTLQKCQLGRKSIDEVILVGGATRTPSIRKMLQDAFQKNELCYSIDADAAVAQGAAIQCAIVSGLVPKHEVRNAMMLDALPHTIGVLVSSGGEDEIYVPILKHGMALPAMSYATFQLADARQKGITIIAVEDVGEDLPLQRIGDFSFLLHRLTEKEFDLLDEGKRTIDVGMTVDADAKFIVSIFDKNDPDDLVKKHRYQQWKRNQNKNVDSGNQIHTLGNSTDDMNVIPSRNLAKISKEEILLSISCFSLLGFYLLVRLLFHEPGEEGAKIL